MRTKTQKIKKVVEKELDLIRNVFEFSKINKPETIKAFLIFEKKILNAAQCNFCPKFFTLIFRKKKLLKLHKSCKEKLQIYSKIFKNTKTTVRKILT